MGRVRGSCRLRPLWPSSADEAGPIPGPLGGTGPGPARVGKFTGATGTGQQLRARGKGRVCPVLDPRLGSAPIPA